MGKKLIVHSSLSCGTHVCGPHLQCLWHAALHMRGAGVRALLPCRSAAPDQSHACDPVPWRPPNARDECPTLARVWGRRDSDKRRCTMAQVRYSRDQAELERLATGVDHRQHWLFSSRGRSTPASRAANPLRHRPRAKAQGPNTRSCRAFPRFIPRCVAYFLIGKRSQLTSVRCAPAIRPMAMPHSCASSRAFDSVT